MLTVNLYAILRFSILCFSLFTALLVAPSQATQTDRVTYCIDPDWMPYEALRNGVHIGISADYLQLISEFSQLNFELLPTDSWQQTLEFAQTGKCMVVAMLNASPNRRQYLYFSLPYFESPNVLVTERNSPMIQGYDAIHDQLVGVVKDYRQAEYIARYYPHIKLRYVDSEAQGLTLLSKGEIDVLVSSLLSVNSLINKLGLDDIVVSGYAEPYDTMGFGINKAYPELLPKINAAIESIPESSRVEIFKRWNNVRAYQYDDYRWFVMVGLGVLAIVLLAMWRKRVISTFQTQLTRKSEEIERLQSALLEKNRTLEFLSSHDSVTGLYNRNYMLHKVEDEVSRFHRFQSPASLILVDFSYSDFRSDKKSQVIAEDLLKDLGTICLNSVREVDVAGRWGPEQIMVLCPQTPITAAKILAERFKSAVENHPDERINGVEFAVGIAALHDNEAFTDWYERVSQAVVASKRGQVKTITISQK